MKFMDLHKNIKIRISESFLSTFVSSMVFPLMAIYLANHFGIVIAGFLLMFNALVGIFMNFIGGYFADQYGRKKNILSAEIIRFIAFFTMMICNSPWFSSPVITFFMMVLNSVCWGLSGPANGAMLIDVSKQEQRKLMYTIMYWANNLAIAVGGILGAILFKEYLFELFMALTIVAGFIVFLVLFFLEETYYPQNSSKKPLEHVTEIVRNYKKVLGDRIFVLFTIAGILLLSLEHHLTNYISIKLSAEMPSQDFLFWTIDGVKMLGILRSENTILVLIFALFALKLTKNIKDKTLLISSCVLFSFGYGMIAYFNDVALLLVFMALLTIGEVCRVPAEQSYMAAIPPKDARSSYIAINGLKFNISMLLASFTITISAFLPSSIIAIIITIVGLTGTLIFVKIIPSIELRKKQAEFTDVG